MRFSLHTNSGRAFQDVRRLSHMKDMGVKMGGNTRILVGDSSPHVRTGLGSVPPIFQNDLVRPLVFAVEN